MDEQKKAAFAAELKKELLRAVEDVMKENEEDDGDHSLDAINEAMKNLCALSDLTRRTSHGRYKEVVLDETKKIDKSQDQGCSTATDEQDGWRHLVPHEFKCPISGSLMVDPVVISSGQTFDKQCIQKWFEDGHQKCPKTGEKLAHTLVIPNDSMKQLILKWCEQNNVQVSTTLLTGDEVCTVDAANQEYLVTLLGKLSSSISDARGVAKEMQTLTNKLPSVRALVSDDASGSITRLYSQLLLDVSGFGEDLHENLVSTLLSISIHENNSTKLLQEIPAAISFLVKCLSDERIKTRSQAAATVCILSEVYLNKQIIGNSGAIKPLIELIKEGHPLALKDAVSAITWLCALNENREIAIAKGAVTVIVSNIIDHIQLDEMLNILLSLSRQQTAIDQMAEGRGIRTLFRLLNDENINSHQKEVCVDILHTICFSDERKVKSIWEADATGEILSNIATTGSERAKANASKILKRLDEDKHKAYRRGYRV